MPPVLTRLLPPSPLARRLSLQSILFAVGDGVFLTGNAVFFTKIVGLSAAQVGLGITIAGVATFATALPLGRLADRVGAQRMWVIGALLEAVLYLAYPWITGMTAFTALVVVLSLVQTGASAGRGAYTLDVFSREERVRSLAFMRSALNIGFTLGALLGGLALATNSDAVIRAVPFLSAVILGANGLLVARLPKARADHSFDPESRRITTGALRNKGYLSVSFFNGVLSTHHVLLTIVIPLWLVQETDAPRTLLALLFGTNTVLAILLQVPAARGANTVSGALRATRLAALAFVASCLIVMVTSDTLGWATILLIWVGHVTVTGAELFQSAAAWGFTAELSDPERRGEYQGATRLGGTLGSVWAPALYTFLAISWGPAGWLVIAAIVVVAAVAVQPAAHAAERYLEAEPTTSPA